MIWVATWYVQDLAQAAFSGISLAPDIFLLVAFFRLASKSAITTGLAWIAFAGGLAWDLRWTAIPGLTAVLYVAALVGFGWLWLRIPDSGRTGQLFMVMAAGAHFLVGLVRTFTWGFGGETILAMFLIQQFLAVTFTGVLTLFLTTRMGEGDVRR
ncbi:MAG: hypothetical protein U9R40_03420 [Synergistota bacterium]|nr:hypothetical protein [Synergistota bacterium]